MRPATLSAAIIVVCAASLPLAAQTTDPSPPASPAVIHACYVPLTGTLYRIKETGLRPACSSTTNIEFAWTDGSGALHGTDAVTGDLAGTFAAPTVVKLQGTPVAATPATAGQVLTFDGTKWGPAAASANSGVVDGSFLATGTLFVGAIPAAGAGVRMMWYPGKAAFRAGQVSASEWDDANVGQTSMAVGHGVTASGLSSIAMGELNVASGQISTATGFRTVASNFASTAMGNETTASGSNSTAIGTLTTASGQASTAMGNLASTNLREGSFVYGDASTLGTGEIVNAVSDNQFVVRAQHIWLGWNSTVVATDQRFLETSTGAYLSSGGVWTNVSDVNRKHLFESVSSDEVLARVAAMPIQEWSYKAEADSVRHLGPTAQDFYAAFHLGSSDTSIGTIDADGVSLAAIQALEKRTRALASENAQLKVRLDLLEAAMQQLQARAHQP
jgi:endosialidase-like protein/trimeric autotransporter adhesin